jgi:prenyltransferase beta subunit
MIKNKLKKTSLYVFLRSCKNLLDSQKYSQELSAFPCKYNINNFEYINYKKEIIKYIRSNKGDNIYEYKFCNSIKEYDLYSSVYAVMTLGLLNEVKNLSLEEKLNWSNYILSFQNKDGFFVDENLSTPLASKIHHWGWYHLLPHLIIALDYLDTKPKYDFKFIYDMFEKQTIEEWLNSRQWEENYLAVSNEIMNITVLLQYSRDKLNNTKAKDYVSRILDWLEINQIDDKTNLWGSKTSRSKLDISKAVKSAYHYLPMFIYDNKLNNLDINSIIKYTLKTQNEFGTYGPCSLTDGCEDIDSLYLLTQLPSPNNSKDKINNSVEIFFNKVFSNMNSDGGFVFQRLKTFQYADSKLKSNINESNMFGTWFRTLSIAYACKYLHIDNEFKFSDTSGYQFYKEYN